MIIYYLVPVMSWGIYSLLFWHIPLFAVTGHVAFKVSTQLSMSCMMFWLIQGLISKAVKGLIIRSLNAVLLDQFKHGLKCDLLFNWMTFYDSHICHFTCTIVIHDDRTQNFFGPSAFQMINMVKIKLSDWRKTHSVYVNFTAINYNFFHGILIS